jgi:myo-inositol-1(or 4)-monophosphatase
LLGLTYDPLQREEFLAAKGKGLRLSGKHVFATDRSLADSTAVFDFGGGALGLAGLDAFHELAPEVLHVRIVGSAALSLAYAACGRIDFFAFAGGMPWDIEAGIALVREGGGEVTDFYGDPVSIYSPGILAGSKQALVGFLDRAEGRPWFKH